MVPIKPSEIGDRIRQARTARRLEQKNLAASTGKSQSYISQLERGEIADPSAFVIRDLETALQVYHGYLTEPAEMREARDAAISTLMRDYGGQLGITPEEETDLRYRLAFIDPGPSPSMMHFVKMVELIRTLRGAS